MWTASMSFEKYFLGWVPLQRIPGKCQVWCQHFRIRVYFLDSRPFGSNTQPGKKSIVGWALMPISPLMAASKEHNACTSPLQQLFNHLNNQAWPRTPRWDFHSSPRFNKPTTLAIAVAPALSSHTYVSRKKPFLWALSDVIVGSIYKRKGLL